MICFLIVEECEKCMNSSDKLSYLPQAGQLDTLSLIPVSAQLVIRIFPI